MQYAYIISVLGEVLEMNHLRIFSVRFWIRFVLVFYFLILFEGIIVPNNTEKPLEEEKKIEYPNQKIGLPLEVLTIAASRG